MSQIHILDWQTDVILDYITADDIIDDSHKKTLEDNLETFDFIAFADRSYSQYIEKRNRVIIPDEDGSLREFIMYELPKYRDTEGIKVQVFTHASYLELKKLNIISPNSFKGTLSQHAGRALNNTGWQVGIVESQRNITLNFNNHISPYEAIRRIAKEFGVELNFRIETNGREVTGRYVDLLERIGDWRGREVEFGKDLIGIKRVEKQDIVTALIGLGPEDEAGNRIEVLVEDFDALQRWGWYDEHGELNHLIEAYEIESERSEMTEAEARQYTRTALNKRIDSNVTYSCEITDLENVPGLEHEKIRFGDTIKIKDTKFNPPLYVEARVFKQERSIITSEKKNIKLGDFIEYTEEQVHAIWEQLKKQIQNRVSHYEMVEYTYNKLTIDDKDETVFEEGKSFAEATGIQAEENAKAFAVEEDSKIKVDVEEYADRVSEQYAESALEQAKQYAVAKEVYDNQMDKIASDMAEKADLEYIDGKLVDKVNKGDVYTKENVDNMINNTVSKTQYETDQEGIVEQLESQGTRIGQNTEAIGLKADSSELDAVEKSLNTKIGEVEVTAEGASITASEVRADLDGLEIGGRNRITNSSHEYVNISIGRYNGAVRSRKHYSEYGLEDGDIATFSLDLMAIDKPLRARVDFYTNSSGEEGKKIHQDSSTIRVGQEGRSYVTFKVTKNTPYIWLAVQNVNTTITGTTTQKYRREQLEKGNKATDWSPAPEDTDEAIDQVSGRVETLDGEIKTVAGEVALKASQSEVDSLENRVSTAEGELKVLPGEISGKVSKDGAFGELNLSPDKAKLDFERVNVTGQLEAKHIKSLAGLNINDQFIVDDNGRVTIGNNRVTIDSSGIEIKRPDGAVWMQDGIVNTSYGVGEFNPPFMDLYEYDFGNGNTESAQMFNAYNKWWRCSADQIAGLNGYVDQRVVGLNYTVGFQRYEFSHDARYLIIGYRRGIDNRNPRHQVCIFDVSDGATVTNPDRHARLYQQWFARGGGGVENMVIDLGKPTFTKKAVELRIGMNKGDKQGNSDSIMFRINRVHLTDSI